MTTRRNFLSMAAGALAAGAIAVRRELWRQRTLKKLDAMIADNPIKTAHRMEIIPPAVSCKKSSDDFMVTMEWHPRGWTSRPHAVMTT